MVISHHNTCATRAVKTQILDEINKRVIENTGVSVTAYKQQLRNWKCRSIRKWKGRTLLLLGVDWNLLQVGLRFQRDVSSNKALWKGEALKMSKLGRRGTRWRRGGWKWTRMRWIKGRHMSKVVGNNGKGKGWKRGGWESERGLVNKGERESSERTRGPLRSPKGCDFLSLSLAG